MADANSMKEDPVDVVIILSNLASNMPEEWMMQDVICVYSDELVLTWSMWIRDAKLQVLFQY